MISLPTNYVTEAVRVLQDESAALATLAKALPADKNFADAVQLVLGLKGRLIVTGVGKSGHVGGKIAATLASTGTPSFFIHPTEALHGDLGMITKDDAVLALSHSGESRELEAIISYCTRFSIPLLALTGKPQSTLGKAATHVLCTLVEREACPLQLAPTTSTTAALALGDALAVALMAARGFTQTDFAKFHPGGKLGAQLLRVHEVMVKTNLPLLPETARMDAVLIELTEKNLGSVGFINAAGKLLGVFTDGDLKRRLMLSKDGPDLLTKNAVDVFTANPKTAQADDLCTNAVAAMGKLNITSLWVLDDAGKPAGLLRLSDCLAKGVV
ncbi:MAG TPA: KpsF/GutQ family sugar-phosphate isomerase [Alphaproteobacteria bacterium]|nr:KpsF/GutQ family sugar-phosphate isomerase [Alphaproteobacteria bacterium]